MLKVLKYFGKYCACDANFRLRVTGVAMQRSAFQNSVLGLLIGFTLYHSSYLCADVVSIKLSPPGLQETPVSDAVVETFNHKPLGVLDSVQGLDIGGVENPTKNAKIVHGSLTGGAKLSNYMMGGPIKIQFEYPTNYLGFWWATIDAENQIELYDVSNNLILKLSGAEVGSFLSKNPNVRSGDGLVYAALAYNGNPSVNSKNALRVNKATLRKKYLYCNIFVDGVERIHSVVIRGDLFEIDNIAISPRHVEPDASMIPMSSYEY